MKAYLAFSAAWAAGGAGAAAVPSWVEKMQRGWGAAYNTGEYEAVAAPLSGRGVVIPSGGRVIVPNGDVLDYLRRAGTEHPREVLLQPTDAVVRGNAYETVGRNGADNTTFYMRLKYEKDVWTIDTAVLASPEIQPIDKEASAPRWLNDKLHGIRALLEAGAADRVVKEYVADGAVAVGVDGALHTSQRELEGDFAMLMPSPTFPQPHLLRLVAFHAEEDVGEYHIVAESSSLLTRRVNRCYMRWAAGRQSGAVRITAFMVSIGAGYEGVAAAGGGLPPTQDAAYGRAYTSGDYATLSEMHAADGVVLPWGGDRFVPNSEAVVYMQAAHKTKSVMQLQTAASLTRPVDLIFGAAEWVHTLGIDRSDGSLYYMRWGMHHDADPTWRLGVTAFNLGAGMTGIPVTPPGVPAWMEAGVAKWVSLYNAAKFEALAGMYSREAVLVPVEVNASTLQFIERGGLAGYFETAAAAAPVVSAVRIVAAAPLGAAWHVIVELAASKQLLIYTRWVREDGQWWVETQLPLGAAPASYDCRTKEMWTRPKQQWCCAHQGLGCPTAGAVCRITDSTFDLSAYCPAGTECLQSEGLGEFTCQGR